MAWWKTLFVFEGDRLIAEGLDPIPLDDYEIVEHSNGSASGEDFTKVIVSGYALYGELRGFYAAGVANLKLDKPAGKVYMSAESVRHTAPISTLTTGQRAAVRECLQRISQAAWESSNRSFKNSFETPPASRL